VASCDPCKNLGIPVMRSCDPLNRFSFHCSQMPETHRLLGAAVLAPEGAELVHVYVDLMNADAPYTVIRDAIHIHPTLAEAVQSVLSRLS
jgi:hypothetical protein